MRRERIKVSFAIMVITAIFCFQVVFASNFRFTESRPVDKVATQISPGSVPMVKGSIQVVPTNPTVHLNPDRPIRKITYDYSPRNSYRSGQLDYYAKSKEARDQTRPQGPIGLVGIKGSSSQKFAKTNPTIYPYETGSHLRPGSAQGPYSKDKKNFGTVTTTPRGEQLP